MNIRALYEVLQHKNKIPYTYISRTDPIVPMLLNI